MSDGNVTLASNVLGTIGTVLWCVQLIPQIWYNWRRKKTDGFPATMMFLWASCSVPMGAYLILQRVNIPLQIPYNKGVTWPDIVVGVVATIFLAGGLLPPYFELWKRDGRVIGFNWVFLSIDTLGGLFSLFALAAQGSFDILGGIMYILVVVLEGGIYVSHIVWRIRYRKLRKEAKMRGISIDDLLNLTRNDTEDTRDTHIGVLDSSGDVEKQEQALPRTDGELVAGQRIDS
ncbi:uncharacterized protein N7503_011113 [Penicillium pulvis]|uniref:uncharacterized protein n=1 Tax=Penicillium pulvis TaxID=1562058 RepID=UPI00254821A8|nr:uncharacterized protein N7503_011113 [Penicillium pulvis]KAJ5785901.1 hypothetical protein N7503_011113 [Penicillium pulvis]